MGITYRVFAKQGFNALLFQTPKLIEKPMLKICTCPCFCKYLVIGGRDFLAECLIEAVKKIKIKKAWKNILYNGDCFNWNDKIEKRNSWFDIDWFTLR